MISMNKYSIVFLAVITSALLSSVGVVTSAFSSTSAGVSYCPPIWLAEVQRHVHDASDALNDGKLIEAGSELDIVSRLLDQLDDMTSKSE